MTEKLKFHPASACFPMMDEKRFTELVEDIRVNGLITQIQLFDGQVLDGRNRYRACLEAGVKPRFVEVHPLDPYRYVWSLNGERRDLLDAQRYLSWKATEEGSEKWRAKLAKIHDDGNRKRSTSTKARTRAADGTLTSGGTSGSTTGSKAAPALNAKAAAAKVGPGTIKKMDHLVANRPDLAKKVHAGELKPGHALREMRRESAARGARELPKGKYRIIYADPPWSYGNSGVINESDNYGMVERHYPPMKLADICALDVKSLAARDSVLWLWVTAPLLEQSFEVIRAWGFKYKANFVWDKVRHNFGNYNSVRHEHLIIATRGSCMPDVKTLLDSVQELERTSEHSRKPTEFRDIIDQLYPNGPRIELFARGEVPANWEAWGNEAAA